MLTTSRLFSARARSIRLKCPAWRAPSVGTSPMDAPSPCHRRATSRISDGDVMTAGPLPGPVLHLFVRRLDRRRAAVGRVRVLWPGECACPYVVSELVRRARDLISEACVPFHEFRSLARG